jgi:hypothetical protein
LQSFQTTALGSGEFGAAAFVRHGFLRPYAQAKRASKKEAIEIPLDFFLLRFFASRQKNDVGSGAKPQAAQWRPKVLGLGFWVLALHDSISLNL